MKLSTPVPLSHWCNIDQPGTTLPLQINVDTPCPVPDVVPDTAVEILVYAGVFCGDTTPEGTGEYEIYVLQPDTEEKAAFFLSVNTGPASSYNNNSENVWLPMPPDRTLHARLTGYAPGATALAGNLSTELRVIAYRIPAGTPTVLVLPATLARDPGQSATFKAVVTGDGPFTYQWRKNGAPLAGETAATLTLASPATGDSGAYDVVVTAGTNVITSAAVTLTVQPVTATVQTTATAYDLGQTATLAATVVSVEPPTYQWQKDGTPLAGQTTATLTLANLQATDAGSYAVVVTAGTNVITSAAVALTVQSVTATVQTAATAYERGQTATLTAAVVSAEPPAYQWQKTGTDLPGQTMASLILADLKLADCGAYTVVVTAGATTATSDAVTLTVQDFAGQVLALNPFAYWPLNEAAGPAVGDLSPNNFTGTAEGGVTFAAGTLGAPDFPGFGAGQNAIALNGTDADVKLPALNLTSNTVTILGWIKPTGVQNAWAGLFFNRDNNTSHAAGFQYSGSASTDSDLRFVWNGANYTLVSALVPLPGQWNLVALVIEPTQATIYLGNTTTALQSTPLPATLAPDNFNVASYLGLDAMTDGENRRFNGQMAQFAVFNQALTAAQITALFNSALPAAGGLA